MWKTWLLASCLATLSATAARVSDVTVTALTADKGVVTSSDQLTLTIRVKNLGPEGAQDVNLNVASTAAVRLFPLAITAPAGWTCSATYTACFTPTLAAGAEAEITMRVLAPAAVPQAPLVVIVANASSVEDLDLSNNRREQGIGMGQASRNADLAIDVSAPPSPIAESTPVTVTLNVRNGGPDAVDNVIVAVRTENLISAAQLAIAYSGPGWTCTPHERYASCRRQSLAAGASAPLDLRFTAPSTGGELYVEGTVFADQPHLDDTTTNDLAWQRLFIGNAAHWRRVLFPVTDDDLRGAGGSLWKTELSVLLDAGDGLEIVPSGCGPVEDPCQYPALHALLDAREEDLIVDRSGSQFVYVRGEHADKLRAATRVYDASRETETAGAFVPSPRDDDFSADGFSLLAVPVAPQFRSMLRIYDYDAREDAKVTVELYGDSASQPFYSAVHALTVAPEQFRMTTALLPAHPATARLDLSPLIPAGTYERIRVAVRPVGSNLRIWGFVSITNNDTHHVTIVAP